MQKHQDCINKGIFQDSRRPIVVSKEDKKICTLPGVFTVTRFRNFLSRISRILSFVAEKTLFDMDSVELNKRSADHVCVCGFLWKNC